MATQIDDTGIETVDFDGDALRFEVEPDGQLTVYVGTDPKDDPVAIVGVGPADAARLARWLSDYFVEA